MITHQKMQDVVNALTYTIDHGDPYWKLVIPKVEDKYKCTYVGDFCLNGGGGWSEEPYAIFYQEKPPVEGYSHYFGLRVHNNSVLITSGQSAADVEIMGVIANNNEIIYSRYRHDYRVSSDGSVMIDGGRDYLKTNGKNLVRLKIVKDELVIIGTAIPEEPFNYV